MFAVQDGMFVGSSIELRRHSFNQDPIEHRTSEVAYAADHAGYGQDGKHDGGGGPCSRSGRVTA